PEPSPDLAVLAWLREGTARPEPRAAWSDKRLILEARGITKNFEGLTALSNVDFTIEEGTIAGLIGPNGAGKTTFFNIVTGLFRPTAGELMFDGRSIVGLRPNRVAERGMA